jgi:hypothetical protein
MRLITETVPLLFISLAYAGNFPQIHHASRRQAESPSGIINGTRYNDTSAVVLDVAIKDSNGRNNTSPLLYGWMFEDISVCCYVPKLLVPSACPIGTSHL